MFRNIHPSGTGGFGRREPKRIHARGSTDPEDEFFKCHQCGFPNDRNIIVIGDSIDVMEDQHKTVTMSTPSGNVDIIENDESKASGCRFCHSLNSDGHSLTKRKTKKPPLGYRG